jgi:predicted ATP-grasp superfamily ATP-dependent carboligase
METVLVLDGNTRSALAATRSLGRRGVKVVLGDETNRILSAASRYCSASFRYPPPRDNPGGFVAAVMAECGRHNIAVIFPMAEITTATILKCREQFKHCEVPFIKSDTFEALTDKWKLLILAQRLNISIPKTVFVNDASSLSSVCLGLRFPIVLKPYRSHIWSHGRWISASVRYANSLQDLQETAAKYECFSQHPFLIQEYISGQAQGIFALYDRGKPMVFFAHQRLRENPPSGGVSVVSESIEPTPAALRMARTMLDYVRWHGVAMVEFKVSGDGTPYLMEVNGRFWGSLQLAIDAGVDFPWLLFQLATGRELDHVERYAVGVRSRWLLGDLARLFKVLTSTRSLPYITRLGKLAPEFFDFFKVTSRYDVNRWDDLKPFFRELSQFSAHVLSRSDT